MIAIGRILIGMSGGEKSELILRKRFTSGVASPDPVPGVPVRPIGSPRNGPYSERTIHGGHDERKPSRSDKVRRSGRP